MKERLSKLLTVKSLVTLILTAVFAYLAITGEIGQPFLTIYTMIISFYFGTQVEQDKKAGTKGGAVDGSTQGN